MPRWIAAANGNTKSCKAGVVKSCGRLRTVLLVACVVIFLFCSPVCSTTTTAPPTTKVPRLNIDTFPFNQLKYTEYDRIEDAKALYKLHDDVDDDDDGSITFSESQDFMDNNKIMANFESDSDGEITFHELWNNWIVSHVHNWTNADLKQWLTEEAEIKNQTLLKPFDNFTGSIIPRMALHDFSFLKQLGIKSFLTRRKIMTKSMDAVLYGPPRIRHSLYRDLVVISACLLALACIAFAIVVRNRMTHQLTLMEARLANNDEQRSNGDNMSMSASDESSFDHTYYQDRIKLLEDEIAELQAEISNFKNYKLKALETPFERAPSKEFLALLRECKQAEERLIKREHDAALRLHDRVRQEIEKVHRKKNSLIGAVQLLHGEGLEKLDTEISSAKAQLEKVKKIKESSQMRWRRIYLSVNVNVVRSAVHQKQSPFCHQSSQPAVSSPSGVNPPALLKNSSTKSDLAALEVPRVNFDTGKSTVVMAGDAYQRSSSSPVPGSLSNVRRRGSKVRELTHNASLESSLSKNSSGRMKVVNEGIIRVRQTPDLPIAHGRDSPAVRTPPPTKNVVQLVMGDESSDSDAYMEAPVDVISHNQPERQSSRVSQLNTRVSRIQTSKSSGQLITGQESYADSSTSTLRIPLDRRPSASGSFDTRTEGLKKSGSKISLNSMKKTFSITNVSRKLRNSMRRKKSERKKDE